MPERTIHPGETVVQALSAASSLLIVERPVRVAGDLLTYACRGCLVLSEDCTRSETSLLLGEMLAHLDKHVAAGHAGAKERSGSSRRASREVRRGVVVG